MSIVEVADALRTMEDLDKQHHNSTDSSDDSTEDNDDKGDDSADEVAGTDDDSASIGGSSDDLGGDGASRARSPEEEHIRAVARTLWKRQVGVLIRLA